MKLQNYNILPWQGVVQIEEAIEEASEEYLSPMVLTDKSNCMLEKLNKNNSTCFCQNSYNFPHLKTQKIITDNFFIISLYKHPFARTTENCE